VESTSFKANSATPVELAGVEVLPERPRRAPSLVRPAEEPTPASPDTNAVLAQIARVHEQQQALAVHLTRQTQQAQAQSRINQQVLAVTIALTRVLAVRFLLFLSLIGAFVLALGAMQFQTIPAIAVLIAYALLTVGPIVALEIRHGRALPPPQAG
jgi:hypothetical protein